MTPSWCAIVGAITIVRWLVLYLVICCCTESKCLHNISITFNVIIPGSSVWFDIHKLTNIDVWLTVLSWIEGKFSFRWIRRNWVLVALMCARLFSYLSILAIVVAYLVVRTTGASCMVEAIIIVILIKCNLPVQIDLVVEGDQHEYFIWLSKCQFSFPSISINHT